MKNETNVLDKPSSKNYFEKFYFQFMLLAKVLFCDFSMTSSNYKFISSSFSMISFEAGCSITDKKVFQIFMVPKVTDLWQTVSK